MATEEWIKRAIQNGKLYEDLPPRVKQHCMQRGYSWADSLANTACGEQEYYEDLLRFYRYNYRLFPYHLSDYVCRMLRVSPFKYYCDLLFTVMREEKSYDQIPNFTAADTVQVVGVGRNEYIDIMNQCKAKKLLWRVNKAIAKEHLPQAPQPISLEPWWIVHVVNIGEAEYRALTPVELGTCKDACRSRSVRVRDLDGETLQALYTRGLLYFEVPIRPEDRVAIPPLEGFVSNKDSDVSGEKGDPIEGLLYAVFVASNERASVSELASILNVDLTKLLEAISVACRLRFGSVLPQNGAADGLGSMQSAVSANMSLALQLDLETELNAHPVSPRDSAELGLPEEFSREAEGEEGAGGIAVVVDMEVTGYLMMGALSPLLKKHSVSLFEGGRVTGSQVISEMITELNSSVEASMGFEGEMQRLASYARALATTLECVRAAGGGRPVEILRKESLAGLAPAAACRVLAHSYQAVVPIAPLPYPPLPLSPLRPGPVNFGATAEASTPWLQLAFYTALQAGPPSLVFVCGQRVWRLPPPLLACTHALISPWNVEAVRAQEVPTLVPAPFLLFTLNEYLARTAIMVQPITLAPEEEEVGTVDIPLPVVETGGRVEAVEPASGRRLQVPRPAGLDRAIQKLGLQKALGYMRLLQLPAQPPAAASNPTEDVGGLIIERLPSDSTTCSDDANGSGGAEVQWVPLQLQLGLPLIPFELNGLVCSNAQAANFLEADSRRQQLAGQGALQRRLFAIISEYGACSNCLAVSGVRQDDGISYVDLPLHNLLFDGRDIHRLDYTDYVQGIGTLCFE